MKRVWILLAALAVTGAACSGGDEEASDESTTSTTAVSTTTWTPGQSQDLIDLCVQDAANRSSADPSVPAYDAEEAPEQCGEDVQVLQAQDCSVTEAALVLTDWDQDKSPLQCPAGP